MSTESIKIDHRNVAPLYCQIAAQVRHLVAVGAYPPHFRLPAIRALARQLRVTPNTIVQAYAELSKAGVVRKRRGAGCFIATGAAVLALEESRRSLEKRIDVLLEESRQMNLKPAEVFRMVVARVNKVADH